MTSTFQRFPFFRLLFSASGTRAGRYYTLSVLMTGFVQLASGLRLLFTSCLSEETQVKYHFALTVRMTLCCFPSLYTRHLSSCLFVGCTHSPWSHSYLCSRGFAPLPPRCILKSIGYRYICLPFSAITIAARFISNCWLIHMG